MIFLIGELEGHVVISDEPALWSERPTIADGHGSVFVLVPQREIGLGPIPLEDYLAHQQSIKTLENLSSLEALRIDPDSLPPFHEEEAKENST